MENTNLSVRDAGAIGLLDFTKVLRSGRLEQNVEVPLVSIILCS